MPIAVDNLSLEGGSSNKLSPGEFFNHVFNFDSDNEKKKYSNWSSFINKNPDKIA